jgi:plastocyanin
MAPDAPAWEPRGMRSILALALCCALGLAACGGSSSNSKSTSSGSSGGGAYGGGGGGGGGGGSTLKLTADKSKLAFDTTSLSAKAGKVTLVLSNPASIPHAIAVQGKGVNTNGPTVQQGGTSKVSVALKPGTYVFYCPVDGHRQAGMQGKLVVK